MKIQSESKPTTKRKMPLPLHNAALWRFHWPLKALGVAFLQYPFIGDPRWLPFHAMLPFKSFCSAIGGAKSGWSHTSLKMILFCFWKKMRVSKSVNLPVLCQLIHRYDRQQKSPTVRREEVRARRDRPLRGGTIPMYVQYLSNLVSKKYLFLYNLQLYSL